MAGTERELTAELARQKDWAGLWRLALGLPLADAIEVVRLIGRRWRPGDEPGRRLLRRLAGAGPDMVRMARDRRLGAPAGEPAMTTLRIEAPHYKYVRAGSFSPDGQRLAVIASPSSYCDYRSAVYEFELPGGACVSSSYDDFHYLDRVLHCGDAIIVAGYNIYRGEHLARVAGGRAEPLDEGFPGASGGFPGCVGGLARYGEGFVVLRRHKRRDPAGKEVKENWLLFYDSRGRVRRAVPAGPPDDRGIPRLAVEPGSGRLAVADGGSIRVYGPSADQLLASARETATVMCFLGPQRLAVGNGLGLKIWRVEEQRVFRSESDPASSFVVRDMVPVPSHRQIALLGGGSVQYFDAETLAGPAGPGGLTGLRGARLWSSPGGDAHALACEECVVVALVTYPLAALAGRPMRELMPADLAAVIQALGDRERSLAARPVLELLRACLEYRVGAGVAAG
jgi:hypothetical protein